MNEVSTTQPMVTPFVSPRSASSAGGAQDAKAERVSTSGNSSPQLSNVSSAKVQDARAENEPKETQDAESKKENVTQAVAHINEYVQSIQRDLQFTVDQELEKTVVKVVDGRSGELIRQIPEEAFLELARKLNEDGELQLVSASS